MILALLLACGSGTDPTGPVAPTGLPLVTTVGPMPSSASFDPFYTQYVNSTGVAVIGSAAVEPRSLERADAMLVQLLEAQAELRATFAAADAYVAVYAFSESADQVPEKRRFFPGQPGPVATTLGGNGSGILMSFMPEDHLACNTQYAEVEYIEDAFVRQFGALVVLGGMEGTSDWSRAQSLYDNALEAGTWSGSQAEASVIDYVAVGVQAWYGLPSVWTTEATGIANSSDLLAEDPGLHALIASWFSRGPLEASCAQQLREGLDADGNRSPQWTSASGSYDPSAPFQGVVNAELPDDDPISVWCERYDDCSAFGPPEVSACREVLARDRGLARAIDVPDFTLELGACAVETSCFDYLDCRYSLQYGPYPWTSDP